MTCPFDLLARLQNIKYWNVDKDVRRQLASWAGKLDQSRDYGQVSWKTGFQPPGWLVGFGPVVTPGSA